jgi:hypothetical protein
LLAVLIVLLIVIVLFVGPAQFDSVLESWDGHRQRKTNRVKEEVELASSHGGFGFQFPSEVELDPEEEDEEEWEEEDDKRR